MLKLKICDFIAGEGAPGAREASEGELIPNVYGKARLIEGFTVNPDDPESSVELDETAEPPRLRLLGALGTLVVGDTNQATGEFTQLGGEGDKIRLVITGTYVGPDSVLALCWPAFDRPAQ